MSRVSNRSVCLCLQRNLSLARAVRVSATSRTSSRWKSIRLPWNLYWPLTRCSTANPALHRLCWANWIFLIIQCVREARTMTWAKCKYDEAQFYEAENSFGLEPTLLQTGTPSLVGYPLERESIPARISGRNVMSLNLLRITHFPIRDSLFQLNVSRFPRVDPNRSPLLLPHSFDTPTFQSQSLLFLCDTHAVVVVYNRATSIISSNTSRVYEFTSANRLGHWWSWNNRTLGGACGRTTMSCYRHMALPSRSISAWPTPAQKSKHGFQTIQV